MNIDFWSASCTCFVLAAVLAVVSAAARFLDRKKQRYSASAEGRVVHIATEPADASANRTEFHDRMYAVIEFYAGGRLTKVKGPVSTYPYPYHVGQKLHICYDPEHTERYEIVRDRRWHLLSVIAYGISIGLMALGCFLFLLYALRVEV